MGCWPDNNDIFCTPSTGKRYKMRFLADRVEYRGQQVICSGFGLYWDCQSKVLLIAFYHFLLSDRRYMPLGLDVCGWFFSVILRAWGSFKPRVSKLYPLRLTYRRIYGWLGWYTSTLMYLSQWNQSKAQWLNMLNGYRGPVVLGLPDYIVLAMTGSSSRLDGKDAQCNKGGRWSRRSR